MSYFIFFFVSLFFYTKNCTNLYKYKFSCFGCKYMKNYCNGSKKTRGSKKRVVLFYLFMQYIHFIYGKNLFTCAKVRVCTIIISHFLCVIIIIFFFVCLHHINYSLLSYFFLCCILYCIKIISPKETM